MFVNLQAIIMDKAAVEPLSVAIMTSIEWTMILTEVNQLITNTIHI